MLLSLKPEETEFLRKGGKWGGEAKKNHWVTVIAKYLRKILPVKSLLTIRHHSALFPRSIGDTELNSLSDFYSFTCIPI